MQKAPTHAAKDQPQMRKTCVRAKSWRQPSRKEAASSRNQPRRGTRFASDASHEERAMGRRTSAVMSTTAARIPSTHQAACTQRR